MLTFEQVSHKLQTVYVNTHSRELAKEIPKENKKTIVTSANARSLSLKSNQNDAIYNCFTFKLTPSEFCKYQKYKCMNSDIFNRTPTNIIQPPMYALSL